MTEMAYRIKPATGVVAAVLIFECASLGTIENRQQGHALSS